MGRRRIKKEVENMNKKGFTLIELLLVIVILGIVTALTLPEFISSIAASDNQKKDHLETLIRQELDMLNKDVGEYDFWYDGKTEINLLNPSYSIYKEKIIRDIDLENCKYITKLIIKKDGNHDVVLNCTD